MNGAMSTRAPHSTASAIQSVTMKAMSQVPFFSPCSGEERVDEWVEVELLELERERTTGRRLEVGVLLPDGALERLECADRDTQSVAHDPSLLASSSWMIASVCSPIWGAPREEVRIPPSTRIGQRVVTNAAPLSRFTSWVMRNALNAS